MKSKPLLFGLIAALVAAAAFMLLQSPGSDTASDAEGEDGRAAAETGTDDGGRNPSALNPVDADGRPDSRAPAGSLAAFTAEALQTVPPLDAATPARSLDITIDFPDASRPTGPVRIFAFDEDLSGSRVLYGLQSNATRSHLHLLSHDVFEELDRGTVSPKGIRGAILCAGEAVQGADGVWSGSLRAPLDKGRVFLHAYADGYWSPSATIADVRPEGEVAESAVGPDEETRSKGFAIAVRRGGSLEISVVSEGDAPLDATKTKLFIERHDPGTSGVATAIDDSVAFEARVNVDAEGRAVIPTVPAGTRFRIAVDHPLAAADRIDVGPAQAGGKLDVTIRLKPGATITGRVVDETKTPVAGADVTVSRPGKQYGFDDEVVRRSRSAADGTFIAEGLLDGSYVVQADANAFLTSKRVPVQIDAGKIEAGEVESGAGLEGVEIELSAGKSISGRVLLQDGSPAAGVPVYVRFDVGYLAGLAALGAARGGLSESATNDIGEFTVTGLGSGPFSVRASRAARKDALEPELFDRLDGVTADSTDVNLVLRPGLGISGYVVDEDGTRVPGVPVDCLRTVSSTTRIKSDSVTTDDEGRFMFDGLTRGEYVTLVRTERYATLEPLEVSLTDQQVTDVELAAPRAMSVSGRILDPSGEPVEDAHVLLSGSSLIPQLAMLRGEQVPPTRSDAVGHFLLLGVPARDGSLAAEADGFAPGSRQLSGATPGEALVDFDVTLNKGGAIEGICFENDGKTSTDRMITIQSTDMATVRSIPVESDGTFRFEGLPPGAYQVVAMAPNVDSAGDDATTAIFSNMRMARAEVVEGETAVVFLGDPPTDPIEVIGVVMRAGEPSVNMTVAWVPTKGGYQQGLRTATTDENGRYSIELTRPGDYYIQLSTFEDGPTSGRISEFSDTIPDGASTFSRDFELAAGTIAGIAFGPDGARASGVRVSVMGTSAVRTDRITGPSYAEILTDGNGAFTFRDLEPDRYQMTAGGGSLVTESASSYGRFVVGVYDIQKDTQIEGVEVRLPAAGSIDCKVVDSSGTGVRAAVVFLRDAQGRHTEAFSFNATDDSGHCRIEGLAPGAYTVCARTSALATVESAPVNVKAGDTAPVELLATDGTILIVKMKQEDGRSSRGLSVSVVDSEGRDVTRRIGFNDAETLYGGDDLSFLERRLGPLPAGQYAVSATNAQGESASKSVTLKPGAKKKTSVLRLK